jgi:Ser/Thr protein kinase RdoA (MazF antagonist)
LKTKSATTEISKKFEDLTYLSQLKALRTLGLMILKNYPIALQSLEFIHHGENTTYKVTARNHKKYLLRLHRNDYHSDAAIHEELNWLKALANSTDLNIPNPVQSKNGIYLEKQATDLMIRRGCVFEWTDGRFFEKSIRPKHFHRLGEIISELHKSTKKRKTIRRYWDTNGLIGKNPTFGSLSGLPFVSKRQQQIIDHASTTLQKILNKYEKSLPERMGLIHADLHLGNILNTGDDVGVIDFDDSGFGFHVYDIVIALMSLDRLLKRLNRSDQMPRFKDALIEGYSQNGTWDYYNEEILPFLTASRRLLMLGWINTRSDNPRLKKLSERIKNEALECVLRLKL